MKINVDKTQHFAGILHQNKDNYKVKIYNIDFNWPSKQKIMRSPR